MSDFKRLAHAVWECKYLVLEDKIVQKAVAMILSAIYEQDFQESSYGFRNKRSAYDALRALELMIIRKSVNYILDIWVES